MYSLKDMREYMTAGEAAHASGVASSADEDADEEEGEGTRDLRMGAKASPRGIANKRTATAKNHRDMDMVLMHDIILPIVTFFEVVYISI